MKFILSHTIQEHMCPGSPLNCVVFTFSALDFIKFTSSGLYACSITSPDANWQIAIQALEVRKKFRGGKMLCVIWLSARG